MANAQANAGTVRAWVGAQGGRARRVVACCAVVAVAAALGGALGGVLGGCQADPDFVMTDAFSKDMPQSLANTLEGAIETQAQAQGAVMDAMALAGAPLGPEDVAQRYEDVRVAMTIAERRARTARVRSAPAEYSTRSGSDPVQINRARTWRGRS